MDTSEMGFSKQFNSNPKCMEMDKYCYMEPPPDTYQVADTCAGLEPTLYLAPLDRRCCVEEIQLLLPSLILRLELKI